MPSSSNPSKFDEKVDLDVAFLVDKHKEVLNHQSSYFLPTKKHTVFLRKQPALEFNPHSNVIRNFWEKKKMKSALECNPQRFCEFWFLIWITTWPTVMEVASCKNRQNTKENAKIWQFLLKATKLVSLNWKMTPNYSVYFGLMEKKKMKSALECNPHSNIIRNFWEKKKRNPRIVFELIR